MDLQVGQHGHTSANNALPLRALRPLPFGTPAPLRSAGVGNAGTLCDILPFLSFEEVVWAGGGSVDRVRRESFEG